MADRRLLVVAFGTRGDVEPLLQLAGALRGAILAQRDPGLSVEVQFHGTITFCTHEAHRELVHKYWAKKSVDIFIGVPTDPLRPASATVADEYEPVVRAASGVCGERVGWVRFDRAHAENESGRQSSALLRKGPAEAERVKTG